MLHHRVFTRPDSAYTWVRLVRGNSDMLPLGIQFDTVVDLEDLCALRPDLHDLFVRARDWARAVDHAGPVLGIYEIGTAAWWTTRLFPEGCNTNGTCHAPHLAPGDIRLPQGR